jgi:hypothetical protein
MGAVRNKLADMDVRLEDVRRANTSHLNENVAERFTLLGVGLRGVGAGA